MKLACTLVDANQFVNPSAASRGAAMGASWEANAINPADNWTTGGWVAWLRRYSRGAVDIPASRVFATAFKRSDEIIALHLDSLLAAKPAWCFVDLSANDILQGISPSILISNTKTVISALQNEGIYPILMPTRALGAGYINGNHDPSSAVENFDNPISVYTSWCKAFVESNNGVGYFDVNPDFIDFSTGRARTGLLVTDNVHDTTSGAQIRGLAAWNYLKGLLPPRDTRFTLVKDTFDAIANPAGNLLSNGLLAGETLPPNPPEATSGDGLALGWSLGSYGGSGVTFTPSKQTYAGYAGLEKQRLTYSGIGSGNGPTGMTGFIYQKIEASKWSEGDVVWAEVEMDYDITQGSVTGIFLSVQQNAGGTIGRDGDPTAYGDWLPGSGSLVLRTDPFAIPSPSTELYFTLSVRPGTGAVAGTVDIARASLRKLVTA